tara:strand:+ start:391 stop:801 length:411 start_codon:yes stop_codon:yes gene_type:complete
LIKIFVFGSNEGGRHGMGAAKYAKEKYGAIYGQGYGLQGQSFGIPTKSASLEILEPNVIREYINKFIDFANQHREMEFYVTEVGCGLALPSGMTRPERIAQIAEMFKEALNLKNVILPKKFGGDRDVKIDSNGEET